MPYITLFWYSVINQIRLPMFNFFIFIWHARAVARKFRNALTLAFLFLAVSLSSAVFAQVTEEQSLMYQQMLDFPSLVKGGEIAPIWLKDGSGFVYWSELGAVEEFMRVDSNSGKKHPFFDRVKLNQVLATLLGRKPTGDYPFTSFEFVKDDSAVRFDVDGRLVELTLADYSVLEVPDNQETMIKRKTPQVTQSIFPVTGAEYVYERLSPDKQYALRSKDYNLWIRDIADNRLAQLTEDGIERYQWVKGFWSKDNDTVAAIKVDSRKVHYMPVLHSLKRKEEISWHMYGQAGGALPLRELHFIDVLSGEVTAVEMGQDATYLRPLGWHVNNKSFLFFWLSRDGKQVELRSADKITGQVDVLWSEENRKTFVVDHMQFRKVAFKLLSDGRFLVSSEKSGWKHLYLYGPKKGKIKQLNQVTKGEFPIENIVHVDEQSGLVYFTAHNDKSRPYDTQLMRVGLNGNGQAQLTEATGHHQIQFSPSGQYFLDTHSTVSRPPVTQLRRADGKIIAELEKANIDSLKEIGWRSPEKFVVKAADGKTNLHGILRKPWNFDPSKKYPVIEFIYGGPQISVVPQTFIPRGPFRRNMIFLDALSQLGFIVVSLDARGTPGRGKAFQDVIYGNWGRHEIADHEAALNAVAKHQPSMDMNRVGIFGSSYGGYYATRALLQAPHLYKVGIASAPAAQLHTILAGASESYFGGGPKYNPQAYTFASNLHLVDQLAGKLLILHPTSDVNAPLSHGIQLIHALIQSGKPHDVNLMPEGSHAFKYSDSEQRHLFWEHTVRDYFLEHLQP